jgi:hypothetical protein
MTASFWWGNWKIRSRFHFLDVDGRIIRIKTFLKYEYIRWDEVYWIGLAQIRNKLRVLINRVMNVLVP